MILVGQEVEHILFGKGIIIDINKNIITICFDKSKKRFLYPDAFPQYITLKDTAIQNKINKLYYDKCHEIEERMKKEQEEYDYRNRILVMTIGNKSQAAFDISINNVHDIMADGFISTGCYLSGHRKGTPRIPKDLQPNSAVILTGYDKNLSEDERRISGIFMVEKNFWGSECVNGQVNIHERFKIGLEPKNSLSFWKYFNRNTFSKHWGHVPFKYIQNDIMQKILLDICEELTGTDQELIAKEFYQYFHEINRY